MWFLSPPVATSVDDPRADEEGEGTEGEKEKAAHPVPVPGPPALAPSDVLVRPFKDVKSAVETARSYLEKKLPPNHETVFSNRKGDNKKGKGRDNSATGMKVDEATIGSVPMEPKMLIDESKSRERSRAESEISVVSFFLLLLVSIPFFFHPLSHSEGYSLGGRTD